MTVFVNKELGKVPFNVFRAIRILGLQKLEQGMAFRAVHADLHPYNFLLSNGVPGGINVSSLLYLVEYWELRCILILCHFYDLLARPRLLVPELVARKGCAERSNQKDKRKSMVSAPFTEDENKRESARVPMRLPRTSNPFAEYLSYRVASSSYCGVRLLFDATLTTMTTFPRYELMLISFPSMVALRLYIVLQRKS
mmetsp:Transcript_45070/g.174894  ORF Transcript_45070/g.174894 Transcript_45070/m.174894 type:complete len:197 (-) Transcript_45070:401-991(-)